MRGRVTTENAGTENVTRRLLGIEDAAAYVGLSVHTLYRMVSQRRIPFVKAGRRTMFDIRQLDDWIKQNTIMPVKGRESAA